MSISIVVHLSACPDRTYFLIQRHSRTLVTLSQIASPGNSERLNEIQCDIPIPLDYLQILSSFGRRIASSGHTAVWKLSVANHSLTPISFLRIAFYPEIFQAHIPKKELFTLLSSSLHSVFPMAFICIQKFGVGDPSAFFENTTQVSHLAVLQGVANYIVNN